jgi:hypothetical protein
MCFSETSLTNRGYYRGYASLVTHSKSIYVPSGMSTAPYLRPLLVEKCTCFKEVLELTSYFDSEETSYILNE